MGACSGKEKDKTHVVQAEEVEVDHGPSGPRVVILGAHGLRAAEGFPDTQRTCYCTLAVAGNEEQARTKQVNNTLDPIWDDEVDVSSLGDLSSLSDGGALDFCVWDADADGNGEVLGKATLEAKRIQEQEGFHGELELQEAGKNVKAFLRIKIALEGKPFPAAPSKEFTVELENPKKKAFGIEAEVQGGRILYVTAVKNGPVQLFNKAAEPAQQLKPGDFIVKVNDIEGDSKQLEAALKKKETSLTLVCRRAEAWRAVIDKRGDAKGPCGIEYAKPLNKTVVLTDIGSGPIETWNSENPERDVRPFDRILAINGKQGKPNAMLKQMKTSARFTMALARPAEAAPPEAGE